jgi:hypothetical protein
VDDLEGQFPTIDISYLAKTQKELSFDDAQLRVIACAERDEGCVSSNKFFNPPS